MTIDEDMRVWLLAMSADEVKAQREQHEALARFFALASKQPRDQWEAFVDEFVGTAAQ